MATPTPRPDPFRNPAARARENSSATEDVDPRWLLKALAAALSAAVVLGYLAVCLVVYLGGWQTLLKPSAAPDQTPASVSLPFQALRFDAATTGTPRLSGWWVPADTSSAPTILYLHGGSGSLSDTVPTLKLLHASGVNVFAFDYRGFGLSDGPHPTEARMSEDASAALDYLVSTRHLPAASIVPYGEGLGAVLAANLSHAHPELRAVVIDNPDPDAFARATANTRSRWLPMRLLIRDRFDIASALTRPGPPRLLLLDATGDHAAAIQTLYRSVPGPRLTVTFASRQPADQYVEAIKRFLDEYLAGSAPSAELPLRP